MKIRLSAPLEKDSIVDGEGIRTVIWTQGCNHHCKGCHNPETHDFSKGFLIDVEQIEKEIEETKNQDGITLSGGDPIYQLDASLEIAKFCKGKNRNVWCYTGYTFEELNQISKNNMKMQEFLNNIDVLVDGKFIEEKKSLNLYFKGSENQRILDIKKSLKENKPIEIEKYKKVRQNSTYTSINNIQNGIFI